MEDPVLDKELLEALAKLPLSNIWENLSLSRIDNEKRSIDNNARQSKLDGLRVYDRSIRSSPDGPSLQIRVYHPERVRSPMPALLWIHGGGYVVGSIEGTDPMVSRLAQSLGCLIVAVNYRLAPENPYPAPLEDCYTALAWVFNHAQALGVDIDRIAVGGLSAGAGLAAGLALQARDRGEYSVLFQFLLCPMLDPLRESGTVIELEDPRLWSWQDNRNGWQAYLGERLERNDIPHYASPLRADDLRRLPAAYIYVGTHDIFIDENIQYAKQLSVAGNTVELHTIAGASHGFEFMAPEAGISKRAWKSHEAALKNAFQFSEQNAAAS